MFSKFFLHFKNNTSLKINTSEVFIDLEFPILHIQEINNVFIIEANGKYKKVDVGFQLEIENTWEKELLKDSSENYLYWGNGFLVNSGQNYENFVTLLANLYCVEKIKIQTQKLPVLIAGLLNDPSYLLTNTTQMKIFFNSESKNDELHSEVFLNIDCNLKTIQFNEKDCAYRLALIKVLSGTNKWYTAHIINM